VYSLRDQRRIDPQQVSASTARQHSGPAIPFVRASAFTPLVGFLNGMGAPVDRWLHRAHISTLLISDPEALVPLFPVYRFIELAARHEHLEDLGRLAGQDSSAFDLGAFGHALTGASNVHEYVCMGIRLIGELSRGTRLWLSSEDDMLRINQHLAGPPGLGRCIADVYTLTLTISMLRRFIGPAWSPGEVRLMAGDEGLWGDRDILGDASLIIGQRHSSFTIARSVMNLPVRRDNAGVIPGNAASRGAARLMPSDFTTSTRQLVECLLQEQCPGIQIAAEAAGMSSRTFQRRLGEAGLSFTGLVTECRLRLAREWLAVSEIPVAEIAATLGYNDASNFSRAFRRQTGRAPVAFRRSSMGSA
jgi:AraC-like DNA-binding protein